MQKIGEEAVVVHGTRGLHTKKTVVVTTVVRLYTPWGTRLSQTLSGSGFLETTTPSFRNCMEHAFLHCSSLGKSWES